MGMRGVSDLWVWVFCCSDLALLSHMVGCAAAVCLDAVSSCHKCRALVGVWHADIARRCGWWRVVALGQLSDAACYQEGPDDAITCDIRLQIVAMGARESYLLLHFSSTAFGICTAGTYQEDARFGFFLLFEVFHGGFLN